MGSHSLLQGIFPTQGSNTGLLHCRQILYHLTLQGNPDERRALPSTNMLSATPDYQLKDTSEASSPWLWHTEQHPRKLMQLPKSTVAFLQQEEKQHVGADPALCPTQLAGLVGCVRGWKEAHWGRPLHFQPRWPAAHPVPLPPGTRQPPLFPEHTGSWRQSVRWFRTCPTSQRGA